MSGVIQPKDKAKLGLALLKEAVIEVVNDNPGVYNQTDLAKMLSLESDNNYFLWTVIDYLKDQDNARIERNGNRLVRIEVSR